VSIQYASVVDHPIDEVFAWHTRPGAMRRRSWDGLMTLPPRIIGWWRHTHRFSDAGAGATAVHDDVDTTVPGAALRATFVYRHR
jgi:ligand-binding SRPBCC domain-containing protein